MIKSNEPHHDRNEEVEHQDDHGHLVDAPQGHRHQVGELHRKVAFGTVELGVVPRVVSLDEHLVRTVSVDHSPEKDVKE